MTLSTHTAWSDFTVWWVLQLLGDQTLKLHHLFFLFFPQQNLQAVNNRPNTLILCHHPLRVSQECCYGFRKALSEHDNISRRMDNIIFTFLCTDKQISDFWCNFYEYYCSPAVTALLITHISPSFFFFSRNFQRILRLAPAITLLPD